MKIPSSTSKIIQRLALNWGSPGLFDTVYFSLNFGVDCGFFIDSIVRRNRKCTMEKKPLISFQYYKYLSCRQSRPNAFNVKVTIISHHTLVLVYNNCPHVSTIENIVMHYSYSHSIHNIYQIQ
jgi:hypothetical protein